MNRWVVLGSAVAVVALIAALAVYFVRRDELPDTVVAETGSIDVTIQTTGRLQARDATIVRSETTGVVAMLGARPGDQVTAGDVLAQLDLAPFDDAIAAAERALADAEFNLQYAEQQRAQAPDDLDRQAAAISAAAQADAARSALAEAREARANSAVLAPSDGVILERLLEVGGAVTPSVPIVRMYAPGNLELLAEVDELDLPNVTSGATARFRPDSFPAEEIEGVVARIAPEARQQGGATVFTTVIEFATPSGLDLRPGMNASVTIVTAERTDVLIIPERALRAVGTRYFVTVVEDGDSEEREVLIGQRGGGFVEIVSGLSAGEEVELR